MRIQFHTALEHVSAPDPDALWTHDNLCLACHEASGQIWVHAQASEASNVEYRNLSPKDQKIFDAARYKEVKTLLDIGAYRILSLQESLDFRRDPPDCVLPSRYVDRWKATDEGELLAKSRTVSLGFQDPRVLQLERSAPSPTQEGFTTAMQVCASNKWSSHP